VAGFAGDADGDHTMAADGGALLAVTDPVALVAVRGIEAILADAVVSDAHPFEKDAAVHRDRGDRVTGFRLHDEHAVADITPGRSQGALNLAFSGEINGPDRLDDLRIDELSQANLEADKNRSVARRFVEVGTVREPDRSSLGKLISAD
jgi:hypothetical protein